MRKIIFEKVRWKNIFSTGDTWIELGLNRSPSTLLVGKNGTGKSTAYEALHLNLFGVPIRKYRKKGEVINNKNNKGALTESFFTIGDDSFMVRRGFKPEIFEIEKNGQLLDQEASARDMQLILNRDILKSDKVGFQITTQVSKAGIQMFMSLKTEERRKFIDDMLECTVLTEMAKLHKGRYDASKSDFTSAGATMSRLETAVSGKVSEIATATELVAGMAQRHIENMQEQGARARVRLDAIFAEVKENEAEIARAKAAIEPAEDEVESLQADVDAITLPERPVDPDLSGRAPRAKKIKEASSLIVDLKSKIRSVENSIDLLKAGYCGACRQEVSEDHVVGERDKETAKIEAFKKALKELQTKHDAWVTEHEEEQKISDDASLLHVKYMEAEGVLNRAKSRVQAAERKVESLKLDVDRLDSKTASFKAKMTAAMDEVKKFKQAESEPHEDTSSTERLERLKADLVKSEAAFEKSKLDYNELATSVEYDGMIAGMLKEGGIKTVVIKKFLPIINRVVNEKLSEMGFYGRFEMDENFDETITQMGGVEMTFNQFSEGEKLRINLALILAWREISLQQGRMCSNLLMFDETLDASLDDDGYEALTEIFKTLDDLNVFIVSHSPDRLDSFIRSKVQFVRNAGFSQIADVSTS